MKILVVIVTYWPDLKLLHSNIAAYKDFVSKIIIWDNTPKRCELHIEGIKIYSTGKNMGLPYAYNFAYKYAKGNGFTHMMTMDQDSVWVNFEQYIKQIEKQNEDAIYIVGSDSSLNKPIQERSFGINSGSIIPISILDATKGFSVDFFLDLVDEYFQYSARELGFRVYLVGNCYIKHTLGSPRKVTYFGFLSFISQNYSPMRLYGIARNNILMFKRFHIPVECKINRIMYVFIKTPLKILLAEGNKYQKMKALVMGGVDGILNRKSRISNFFSKGIK